MTIQRGTFLNELHESLNQKKIIQLTEHWTNSSLKLSRLHNHGTFWTTEVLWPYCQSQRQPHDDSFHYLIDYVWRYTNLKASGVTLQLIVHATALKRDSSPKNLSQSVLKVKMSDFLLFFVYLYLIELFISTMIPLKNEHFDYLEFHLFLKRSYHIPKKKVP